MDAAYVALSTAAITLLSDKLPAAIEDLRAAADSYARDATRYCASADSFTAYMPGVMSIVRGINEDCAELRSLLTSLRLTEADEGNIVPMASSYMRDMSVNILAEHQRQSPTMLGMPLEGNYPNLHSKVRHKMIDFSADINKLRNL